MSSSSHPDNQQTRPKTSKLSGTKSARPPKRASKSAASDQAAPGQASLVVGIGASAGGLDAFKTFFMNMPSDSGMAFVLVQHLSPDHKSMLADLLGKTTAMTVIEADDRMRVMANHVYVIPPDATLTINDRTLRVVMPAPPREHRRPIDTFFSSLAEDQGENAVCIVLSGTGSDGALGLTTIKEHGGLTLAQAEFDHSAMSGMPHSAAATGFVDHVMPVEKMPARLVEYQQHLSHVAGRKDAEGVRGDASAHLTAVSTLLRTKIGHDFSQYKEQTLVRRIQRRMQVLRIDTVPAYIARLREEPSEAELLFRELLIGVTQFFRDPDAFEALQTAAISKLLENRGADDPVRIWVPACATGEEVYSIAILVREEMERRGTILNVQVFGTDIDERAVTIARAGRYPMPMTGASPERIERWFAEEGDECCPIKAVREMCVFSTHSVVKDPPFSKLDLISCRNLLIYFDAELQDRVVQTFHYALRPGGMLFLGSSEGLSRSTKLFTTLDKKHRIFQRRDAEMILPALPANVRAPTHPAVARPVSSGDDRIDKGARRALEKYSPVYVVIDKRHEILRFSGSEIGRYLGPSPGSASLNLFDLLRKPLRSAVRASLQAMSVTKEPAVQEGVALKIEGRSRTITVIVTPLVESGTDGGLCVVAFQDAGPLAPSKDTRSGDKTIDANVQALEQELHTTKTQLQAAIDEFEIVNEEMKSANEEYQSVNEELQSSNEELETSKEEMQSVNEELQTINAEMSGKNELLTRLNSDLKNLFDSTEIATIFLDNDLRIKSFTPGMTDIFHLREADRGRPITEIVTLLSYAELRGDIKTVMRRLSPIEREVAIPDASTTFIMRIRPYRTVGNVIDGVVVTFIDISQRKLHEEGQARLAAVVDSSNDAIISTSLDSIITSWNVGAERLFGYSAKEAVGKPITMLYPPDRIEESREILSRIRRGERIDHSETARQHKDGRALEISLTVSPIKDGEGKAIGVSEIAQDVAERKQGEAHLRESEERYRTLFEAIDEGFCIIEKVDTKPSALSDFRYLIANPSFATQAGVANVVGKTIREAFPGESQEWFDIYDAVLRTGEAIRFERDLSTQGRVLELYAFRLDDATQRRVAVIFADITARKRAETHQQLLVNELNHRVKNTLAAVQSIAAQSLKGALDVEHRKTFEARLIALARTHDLLSQGNWENASLRDVLLQELEPYRSDEGTRFVVEGSDLALNPKAALALGMAFHELATNAAKYGALSRTSGQIRVTWDILNNSEPGAFRLKWKESGGPLVKQTERKGFGSTVIERGLSLELDGEVQLDFDPGGLVCTMEIPLATAGMVNNAR